MISLCSRCSSRTSLPVGAQGERVAAAYLRSRGYRILGMNVRIGRDEIDILAQDPVDNSIVFAEVKTRSTYSKDFSPSLGMTHKKKVCLRRAARSWVAKNNYDGGYRIDALFVVSQKVLTHIKELSWE